MDDAKPPIIDFVELEARTPNSSFRFENETFDFRTTMLEPGDPLPGYGLKASVGGALYEDLIITDKIIQVENNIVVRYETDTIIDASPAPVGLTITVDSNGGGTWNNVIDSNILTESPGDVRNQGVYFYATPAVLTFDKVTTGTFGILADGGSGKAGTLNIVFKDESGNLVNTWTPAIPRYGDGVYIYHDISGIKSFEVSTPDGAGACCYGLSLDGAAYAEGGKINLTIQSNTGFEDFAKGDQIQDGFIIIDEPDTLNNIITVNGGNWLGADGYTTVVKNLNYETKLTLDSDKDFDYLTDTMFMTDGDASSGLYTQTPYKLVTSDIESVNGAAEVVWSDSGNWSPNPPPNGTAA